MSRIDFAINRISAPRLSFQDYLAMCQRLGVATIEIRNDLPHAETCDGTAPAAISGGLVSFTPGARTAWHTHPLGQTLYVVSGLGRVQMAEGPVQAIRPGDLVWIPAGVKHWHGAAPDTPMTHLALAEQQDGQVVTWLAQVSERDYRASVAGDRN